MTKKIGLHYNTQDRENEFGSPEVHFAVRAGVKESKNISSYTA